MQHGGDIYRNKVKMDHSVNLNPLGIPAEVLSAVRSSLDRAGVYPDLLQGAVRKEIAASVGGSSASVLAGSGASELLMGAVRVIMPKKALLFEPCFSGYQHTLTSVGCEICHHILTEEKGFRLTAEDLEAVTPDLDLILLSDPVNPTGQSLEDTFIEELLEKAEKNHISVILDESFLMMSDKAGQGHSDHGYERVQRYEGLWVLCSMTKLLAMPGIRMGYVISGKENIRRLTGQLPEWNLSIPAEAGIRAGLKILRDEAYIGHMLSLIREEREYLSQGLGAFGFTVYDSQTAFLLFRGPEDLYERLLARGILIRDCSDFRGLGKGYYRIAVKKHEENVALLRALGRMMEE